MKGINFFLLLILVACASGPMKRHSVLNESLRLCYVESDSYTGKDGSVQGTMTTSLNVTSEGKVNSCKIIKNDFKDPNLNACVCGIFKQTQIENVSKSETILIERIVDFKPVNL
jgi:hypothetical protein